MVVVLMVVGVLMVGVMVLVLVLMVIVPWLFQRSAAPPALLGLGHVVVRLLPPPLLLHCGGV